MEDFYMNITSQNNSYDYSSITSNYSYITSNYSNITYNYYADSYYEHYFKVWFIRYVVTCVIVGVGLLSTLIAIYILYSQIRNDHVVPIYVINLLISDLIQLCCSIVWVAPTPDLVFLSLYCIYYATLVASVCFMVCIALERYLVIVHPLWYRYRRNIKISVVVCVLVWVLALVSAFVFLFYVDIQVTAVIFSTFLLLPFPLFIFFLGGTLKALSATRVPSDEKRRIVAVLVLVLLIYTLLFLPNIISDLTWITRDTDNFTLFSVSFMFLKLSPLADLALYIFMRKGTADKLLSFVCCCRMDSDDTNSPSV